MNQSLLNHILDLYFLYSIASYFNIHLMIIFIKIKIVTITIDFIKFKNIFFDSIIQKSVHIKKYEALNLIMIFIIQHKSK